MVVSEKILRLFSVAAHQDLKKIVVIILISFSFCDFYTLLEIFDLVKKKPKHIKPFLGFTIHDNFCIYTHFY